MTDDSWLVTTVRLDGPLFGWPDPSVAPAGAPPPDPDLPPMADSAPDSGRRQTLTVGEVAAILGWGRSKTYAALRRGDIPARRIGARGYLVTIPEFARWLEGGTGS